MPVALLAGAFGQRNPGDEALLGAFSRRARRLGRRRDHRRARRDRQHGVGPPSDRDRRASPARRGGSDARRVRRRHRVQGAARDRRPPAGRCSAGRSRWRSAPRRSASPSRSWASAPRDRRPARRRSRARLADQADLLVLRDEESADLLADAGAPSPFRVGADPAWTLLTSRRARAPPTGGAVVVALSHEAGGRRPGRRPARRAGARARRAGHRGRAPAVAARRARHPDDLDSPRAVARRASATPRARARRRDLAEARATLRRRPRSSSALRFHAPVAAAAAGVPFVAYAHEPKLAARRGGSPAGGPARRDADGARRRRRSPPRSTGRAGRRAVRAELARAEEGFRLLRLLLNGGRAEERRRPRRASLSLGRPAECRDSHERRRAPPRRRVSRSARRAARPRRGGAHRASRRSSPAASSPPASATSPSRSSPRACSRRAAFADARRVPRALPARARARPRPQRAAPR